MINLIKEIWNREDALEFLRLNNWNDAADIIEATPRNASNTVTLYRHPETNEFYFSEIVND